MGTAGRGHGAAPRHSALRCAAIAMRCHLASPLAIAPSGTLAPLMRSSDSIYSSYLRIAQYTCNRFNIARDNQGNIYCVTTVLTDYLLRSYNNSFPDYRISCSYFIYRRTWTCSDISSWHLNDCFRFISHGRMSGLIYNFVFGASNLHLSIGFHISDVLRRISATLSADREQSRWTDAGLSPLLTAARSILAWQVQGLGAARDTRPAKTETH